MKDLDVLLAYVAGQVLGFALSMIIFAAFVPVEVATWPGKIFLGVTGVFLYGMSARLKSAISTK